MDITTGIAAEMKEGPVDNSPLELEEEATDSEYETHNALIKDRLVRLMEDNGVTNPARRRAMCQRVTEKVEMYFTHKGPIGEYRSVRNQTHQGDHSKV